MVSSEIIHATKPQRIDDKEELQQLIGLKNEIRSGISTAADNLDLDKISYAFYQLLEENEIDKAIAVALAPEIKGAIAKLIVVDWINKEDVQREMRKRLRRLFLARKIPRNKAEPIIIKLMAVAKVLM